MIIQNKMYFIILSRLITIILGSVDTNSTVHQEIII